MPGPEVAGGADLFGAYLGEIRVAVDYIARKNRLSADEREEFTSQVYLKLVDRDYAVLRKFGGRSSVRTYLAVVIQRLLLDQRTSRWGKWRPSRRTRRDGPVAVLLDRLITREGMNVEQACAMARTVHGPAACQNLTRFTEHLVHRVGRYRVDESFLNDVPSLTTSADRLVESAERRRIVRIAARALANAFASLPSDDRLILHLRFVDNLRIREIARRLDIPCSGSKQLYARIRRQLTYLGGALERAGVDRAELLQAIGEPDTPAIPLFARVLRAPAPRAGRSRTHRPLRAAASPRLGEAASPSS